MAAASTTPVEGTSLIPGACADAYDFLQAFLHAGDPSPSTSLLHKSIAGRLIACSVCAKAFNTEEKQ